MLICQKNKSIAHRDIKPENVLIQKNASLHNVSYIHMAKVCKTRGLRQTESSVESTVLTVVQGCKSPRRIPPQAVAERSGAVPPCSASGRKIFLPPCSAPPHRFFFTAMADFRHSGFFSATAIFPPRRISAAAIFFPPQRFFRHGGFPPQRFFFPPQRFFRHGGFPPQRFFFRHSGFFTSTY
ncbi:unnamed protein product [Oikopleura dioica]|uniref:Protein kinase domain-containing protein n=1 Tax=Oikopleura dioica TaxID=34765 RepID=E4YDX0_OIKDI|nr:unnamed protein product [Oikopleura dioica]